MPETSEGPQNLSVQAYRRPIPEDSDYVTTITASGDVPRTVHDLAKVLDPRQWARNPHATYFKDVRTVTDWTGLVSQPRPEPIGTSWSEPGWISEEVTDGTGVTLVNTLRIEFTVDAGSLRCRYSLGETVRSSSTLALERDFGFINADADPGRPGWSRVCVEKNVRFSGYAGTSGGAVEWGDLVNVLAPGVLGKWLWDMRHMLGWSPAV